MGNTTLISSDFWSDSDVEKWSLKAQYLFLYLLTSPVRNQACLYEVTPKRICDDTKLTEEELPALFKELDGKVVWYPRKNKVWVVNYVQYNVKNPSWLIKVCKELMSEKDKEIVKKFFGHNQKWIDTEMLPHGIPEEDAKKYPNIKWCNGCNRPRYACDCPKE